MWAIRFLNGERVGQTIPLKKGKNILGRSPDCDIKITSNGVSKKHLEIDVLDGRILFKDLHSSNGSFINGVRIEQSVVQPGDKLGLHETLIDIMPMPAAALSLPTQGNAALNQNPTINHASAPFPSSAVPYKNEYGLIENKPHLQSAENLAHLDDPNGELMQEKKNEPQSVQLKIRNYFESVAMPGIYNLPTLVDFRIVIASLLALFIIIVTLLSSIPMTQLTKFNIQKESRRRTLTIARTLAQANYKAVIQNNESLLTTSSAELEEGVTHALIISQANGSIIAPADKSGDYSKNLPFINIARRENKELVEQLDSSTIGASVPVSYFDTSLGTYRIKAYAIILYDMGSLAVDQGQALSLFIQTLLIALIFGAILFFLIYKLIEFPILGLNHQVDRALKLGDDSVQVDYKFPALQKLITNVNSLLSRSLNENIETLQFVSKESEAENILHLIGYPAIAIKPEGVIVSVNEPFEDLIHKQKLELQNSSLAGLSDQALQLNLEDLIERSKENPTLIASGEIRLSGDEYQINCQSVCGPGQVVEYVLVSFIPTAYDEDVS